MYEKEQSSLLLLFRQEDLLVILIFSSSNEQRISRSLESARTDKSCEGSFRTPVASMYVSSQNQSCGEHIVLFCRARVWAGTEYEPNFGILPHRVGGRAQRTIPVIMEHRTLCLAYACRGAKFCFRQAFLGVGGSVCGTCGFSKRPPTSSFIRFVLFYCSVFFSPNDCVSGSLLSSLLNVKEHPCEGEVGVIPSTFD